MIIHNWRDILMRAWSVKLLAIAAILTGIETAMPLLDGYIDIPRKTFAALTFGVVCTAFIARFLAQKGLSK